MKDEKKKGGLILSPETIVILKDLKGEDKNRFIDCIIDYHENGTTPNESVCGAISTFFKVFRMTYDYNQKKYDEKCEKLRNNARSKRANASKSKQIESNNNNNNNNNVTNVTEEDIINPLNPPGGYESCDLSFIDDAFREVFYSWLDYKKQKKQKYNNQKSLTQCYKNLLKLSGNNPDTARQIVEQSIGNNYAGLFALKTLQYGTTKASNRYSQSESPSDQQLVADTFDLINEARAREGYDDSI
jgi:hypothetical protein